MKSTSSTLLELQQDPRTPLEARILCGLRLGVIGHPHLTEQQFIFENQPIQAILPPMQKVPAGIYLKGSSENQKNANKDEYIAFRETMVDTFWIGRYPVTNMEFALFVKQHGYVNDCWWSVAGREWKHGGDEAHATAIESWISYVEQLKDCDLEQLSIVRGWRPERKLFLQHVTRLDDKQLIQTARQLFKRSQDAPAFWNNTTLNSPTKPVVGVNWFEAEAYCNWLSAITRQDFRLPHETEWEKAARGIDGREYPWGDEFNADACNTLEGAIYTTTPIGTYPMGVSQYGLFDTSGNVWEWTADQYEPYPASPVDQSGHSDELKRVCRGGSWDNVSSYARCASRDKDAPSVFADRMGFRLASSAHNGSFLYP